MSKKEEIKKLEELLEADRYGSPIWKAGSLSERVEWLISMYEFKKQEVHSLEHKVVELYDVIEKLDDQLNQLGGND